MSLKEVNQNCQQRKMPNEEELCICLEKEREGRFGIKNLEGRQKKSNLKIQIVTRRKGMRERESEHKEKTSRKTK